MSTLRSMSGMDTGSHGAELRREMCRDMQVKLMESELASLQKQVQGMSTTNGPNGTKD